METIDGLITIVQESRFQLTDDAGVSHLFILSHKAAAEPEQLSPLQRRQARVRVTCSAHEGATGRIAYSIDLIGDTPRQSGEHRP